MPLITAVRRWLRRERDFLDTTSAETLYFVYWYTVWAFRALVLLPVAAFLVLVGIVYEVIARSDRREWLDEWTKWTLSAITTIGVVALAAIAVLAWV